MPSQDVQIVNKLGLHARAASAFVGTARKFGSEIAVSRGEKNANGKNIMSMLLLEASQGTFIHLDVNGEDESDALTALVNLIDNRFGEAE